MCFDWSKWPILGQIKSIPRTDLCRMVSERHRRLLVGFSIIASALIILALVLYEWKSIVYGPALDTIHIDPFHGSTSVKKTTGLVSVLKRNLHLVVPAIAIIVLAVISIALYLFLHFRATKEQAITSIDIHHEEQEPVETVEPLFSLSDAIFIFCCLFIIIGAIIGTIRIRARREQKKEGEEKSMIEQVTRISRLLLESRRQMTDAQKCTTEKNLNYHKTYMSLSSTSVPEVIYCPPNFSLNSVWLAKTRATGKSQLDQFIIVLDNIYIWSS